MITFFENAFGKQPYYKSLDFAFERIKAGKSKAKIERIRTEENSDKRNELKVYLPSVRFSGEFSDSTDNSLIKHSGYVILDFDKTENCENLKQDIFKEPFTKAAWISPSGNGVKALVKIKYPEKHRQHYRSLMEYFKNTGISPDEKNINVSRICYESYDPKILVKDTVTEYDKFIDEKTYVKIEIKSAETDEGKIYAKLKKWAETRGEFFVDGNRNNFLMKMAAACNRTGISKHSAFDFLAYDFVHGSSFSIKELQSVMDSIYTRYASSFNSTPFENSEHVITEHTFSCDMPVQDLIYFKDVWDNMQDRIDRGITKGETTHFKKLDNHFRWMRREVTVLNGYGNHGKSTMAYQLMLFKSVFCGYKWAIFNPENSPADFFYQDIAEMYVGKRFDRDFPNHATQDEIDKAKKFINDHFFYIYPKDESPTPEYVLKRFMETIIKHKIDGVVIDPFNQMVHDRSGRDDHYLESFFNMVKRFAQNNDIFFLIVTHPKSPVRSASSKIYEEPTAYELAGGAMWNNKPDNMLCYHRPNYFIDPKDTICTFGSQRIRKQKMNGIGGKVWFYYNVSKSRFFELESDVELEERDRGDGFNPLEKQAQNVNQVSISLKPNTSFDKEPPLKVEKHHLNLNKDEKDYELERPDEDIMPF